MGRGDYPALNSACPMKSRDAKKKLLRPLVERALSSFLTCQFIPPQSEWSVYLVPFSFPEKNRMNTTAVITVRRLRFFSSTPEPVPEL